MKNINIFYSVTIKGSFLYLFEIDIFVFQKICLQCGKINIIYRYIYILYILICTNLDREINREICIRSGKLTRTFLIPKGIGNYYKVHLSV